MSKRFFQVLLPLALDEAFTYFSEKEIDLGAIVLVEFGRKNLGSCCKKRHRA